MEILIPGLILVALMVWASTKIKKTAADAFEPESIETETYSLRKPDGFLHVLGNRDHEFYAYSKEYGQGALNGVRRATITIDILENSTIDEVRNSIKRMAEKFDVVRKSTSECEIETEETANETSVHGFYRIIATQNAIYRLRVAALSEYVEEYAGRAKDILDSFSIRTK